MKSRTWLAPPIALALGECDFAGQPAWDSPRPICGEPRFVGSGRREGLVCSSVAGGGDRCVELLRRSGLSYACPAFAVRLSRSRAIRRKERGSRTGERRPDAVVALAPRRQTEFPRGSRSPGQPGSRDRFKSDSGGAGGVGGDRQSGASGGRGDRRGRRWNRGGRDAQSRGRRRSDRR